MPGSFAPAPPVRRSVVALALALTLTGGVSVALRWSGLALRPSTAAVPPPLGLDCTRDAVRWIP